MPTIRATSALPTRQIPGEPREQDREDVAINLQQTSASFNARLCQVSAPFEHLPFWGDSCKPPQEIAEGKECHAAPCAHEIDVVACAMWKAPTHLREYVERLGKMGTDHDCKKSGTDQLQAGRCRLLPCKGDDRGAQGKKDQRADDNQTAFHAKYDAIRWLGGTGKRSSSLLAIFFKQGHGARADAEDTGAEWRHVQVRTQTRAQGGSTAA